MAMKTRVRLVSAAVLTVFVLASAQAADTRDAYMATLKSLCGQRFEGALTYAIDPKNDFVGKKMSAVVVCTDTDVRMPVQVGEDRSRTWIFTRSAAGLDLRHDHRHADGTPDAVTMYGGMANDSGSALAQSFNADAHTFKVFPGSETNIWTISLSADGTTLTYHLERHAKPRITFVLRRVPR
jgi:hypothetical protein